MKIFITLLLIIFSLGQAFSLSTEELRSIMDKPQATVDDAIKLTWDISQVPKLEPMPLGKLDKSSPLTVGSLGMVLIEYKVIQGGLLYRITRWKRYAAQTLKYYELVDPVFSWNRTLSGAELIEIIAATRPEQTEE